MEMETYYVKVQMEVQIFLPVNAENPEYDIECLIDEMSQHHDDRLCCVVDVTHEISGTASQAKSICAEQAFVR